MVIQANPFVDLGSHRPFTVRPHLRRRGDARIVRVWVALIQIQLEFKIAEI